MDAEKKNKLELSGKKIKANATAVGEWFKQAAWLQVILIVGIIFGLLLSIPAIIKSCEEMNSGSDFFEKNQLKKYDDFQKLLSGNDGSRANGLVGDGNLDGTESYSESKEGFVILFYNETDSDMMGDYQSTLEDAYNNLKKYNSNIGNKTKFYTLNVSYIVGDTSETPSDNIGKANSYSNKFISREQQKEVFNSLKEVYKKQVYYTSKYGINENYINTSVDVSKMDNSDFTLDNAGSTTVYHTIPTCFVTFVKNKGDKAYDLNNPDKVIFTSEKNITTTSETSVIKQFMDLYNFKLNVSN